MKYPFDYYFLKALRDLKQTSTIDQFYTNFELLRAFVLNKYLDICKEYFLSRFILGLKQEIQVYVFQHPPTNLIDANDLACIYEYSHRVAIPSKASSFIGSHYRKCKFPVEAVISNEDIQIVPAVMFSSVVDSVETMVSISSDVINCEDIQQEGTRSPNMVLIPASINEQEVVEFVVHDEQVLTIEEQTMEMYQVTPFQGYLSDKGSIPVSYVVNTGLAMMFQFQLLVHNLVLVSDVLSDGAQSGVQNHIRGKGGTLLQVQEQWNSSKEVLSAGKSCIGFVPNELFPVVTRPHHCLDTSAVYILDGSYLQPRAITFYAITSVLYI